MHASVASQWQGVPAIQTPTLGAKHEYSCECRTAPREGPSGSPGNGEFGCVSLGGCELGAGTADSGSGCGGFGIGATGRRCGRAGTPFGDWLAWAAQQA